MNPLDFSRNLIKGRITETIFEQMLREEGKYTVIPFGYEHTMPTLAQYRHISDVPKIIDNISDAPDFALVSEDRTKLYLVEVKFQSELNMGKIIEASEKLLRRWEYPWLFVATHKKFHCAPCSAIVRDKIISECSESWVKRERQAAYLNLLNDFIR